jgi:hypothetical protein
MRLNMRWEEIEIGSLIVADRHNMGYTRVDNLLFDSTEIPPDTPMLVLSKRRIPPDLIGYRYKSMVSDAESPESFFIDVLVFHKKLEVVIDTPEMLYLVNSLSCNTENNNV